MVPTAPDDYTSVENVLTFSPGVNESCTTIIPIVDDSVLESDEVFSVTLSTTDSDVSLDPASATVTILDNDGKTILFVIDFKFFAIKINLLSIQLSLLAYNSYPTL